MKILAIETATEACSAALYVDGEITSRYELAPRKHTQLILPMMESILDEAGVAKKALDAIAFGRGPGAFTGLRIAVGIAQGLALATDKPVIPVSTLAAMSQQILESTSGLVADNVNLIPALDARMGEVYWGQFAVANGEVELVGEEQISKPIALYEKAKSLKSSVTQTSAIKHSLVVVGSGWDMYLREFKDDNPNVESLHHVAHKFPDA